MRLVSRCRKVVVPLAQSLQSASRSCVMSLVLNGFAADSAAVRLATPIHHTRAPGCRYPDVPCTPITRAPRDTTHGRTRPRCSAATAAAHKSSSSRSAGKSSPAKAKGSTKKPSVAVDDDEDEEDEDEEEAQRRKKAAAKAKAKKAAAAKAAAAEDDDE